MNKSPTGCRSDQLFGLWLMDSDTLDAYRARATAIDFAELAKVNAEAEQREAAGEPPAKPYPVENGVAVISISGPTTKYPTSYQRIIGGTSTMFVERQLSQAHADADVRAIMLHFDTAPGGTVAGAYELVDRIRAVRGKGKPIVAHGSDQMTSAAYLFASQCDRVTANRNAVVGSIGTRAELIDTSKKLERDGVRVIPIASGKYKAAGLPGTEITPEQVADFQRQIDAMNDQFIADVSAGRGIPEKTVRGFEARCYVGKEAMNKGLIDAVASFDDVLAQLQSQTQMLPAGSGTLGAVLKPAAPQLERSPRMGLLTELQTLFGAADMTEDQAASRVRALKSDQATSAAALTAAQADVSRLKGENAELAAFRPKTPDPEMLRDRAELVTGKIDVAVAKQELPAVLAGKLKAVVLKDGKPNAFLLTQAPELGARPVDFMLDLFAGEKLGGPAAGSQTGVQSMPRQTPGGETDEAAKAEQKSADDEVARLKAAKGL